MAKINRGGSRKVRGYGLRGMGAHKHGTCGHCGRSPRWRHMMKRVAEMNVKLDRSRIIDPRPSLRDLFGGA